MSDSLKVTGEFIAKYAKDHTNTSTGETKTYYSFFLDLTDNPDYPNTPEFRLRPKQVDMVDGFKKGDRVTVHFNLSGWKYKNERGSGVITSVNAWKVELATTASPVVDAQVVEASDDLPF